MKNYPSLNSIFLNDIKEWIDSVTRERRFDVEEFDDIENTSPRIFDVPSSSSDLNGTEKVGDLAFDDSYLYYVCDNSGTLEWRRISGSSF